MSLFVAIPLGVRLAALFVLGACVGSLANLGIYRLAWHPRSISPWSRGDPEAPDRRLADRLPMVGWLGLRREAGLHGTGFWIRPMLLELLCGIGFATLYWWETQLLGLLPPGIPRLVPDGPLVMLHVQYAAHLLLITLMLVASMIDLDEWTIPDAITVPGTLSGLFLAAVYPQSLLPGLAVPSGLIPSADFWRLIWPDPWPFLQLTSPTPPNPWPPWLDGFPQAGSLAVGLGCWWLWCVGLMPRSWYSRHGWRRALQLCGARLVREPATYRLLLTGAIGSGAVAWVWFLGGRSWAGLLSALVGVAAGGGLVWVVRILGAATLKKEAMGFGDVTLMAMIGAFLGWQTCLIVFFVAPLFALGVGIVRLLVLRVGELPYGPYLCLGTLLSIVYWAAIWDCIWPYFGLGWLMPLMVLCCLALMAPLLVLSKRIGDALRGRHGRRAGG